MVELLASIRISYVYLTVLAEGERPSALYRFYETIGFHCFPFSIEEYKAGFPFRFARLSPAKRRAALSKIQSQHPRAQSNNVFGLQLSCGYMIARTEELLEKLTASISRGAA
jgi:hypothetical protein